MVLPPFGRRPNPVIGVAVVTVAALALAGCSSQNSGTPGASSSSSTSSTSSTTTSSPTTSSTQPSPPQCSTGVISADSSFAGAAAGTSSYTITLTNDGPSACSLNGYPAVAFFGSSGAGGTGAGPKLPVSGQDVGSAPAVVSLVPKGSAQFGLSVHDVPVNGQGCSTVASMQITPPNGSESISIPESFQVCGDTVDVTAFGPTQSTNS